MLSKYGLIAVVCSSLSIPAFANSKPEAGLLTPALRPSHRPVTRPFYPIERQAKVQLDLLTIKDQVDNNQYVTTLQSSGSGVLSGSESALFGARKMMGRNKRFATWYTHDKDESLEAFYSPSPSRVFRAVANSKGSIASFSGERFVLPSADYLNPVLSESAWAGFDHLALNGSVNIGFKAKLKNGQERDYQAVLRKRAELVLGRAAGEPCKAATVDGQEGKICVLRTIASQSSATTAGGLLFTIRSKINAPAARFRVGPAWHRLGDSINLAEFAKSRAIEVFISSADRQANKTALSTLSSLIEAGFYSSSRLGKQDRFEVSLTGQTMKPESNLAMARLELLMIDDQVSNNQYISTLSSVGTAANPGDVQSIYGARRAWSGDFIRPAMWYLHSRADTAEVSLSDLAPQSAFTGLADQNGRPLAPRKLAREANPILSEAAWSALQKMPVGSSQILSAKEQQDAVETKYQSSVIKTAQLLLQSPQTKLCQSAELEGMAGQKCILRSISGHSKTTNSGDLMFTVRSKVDLPFARFRVANQWHQLGESVALTEFASSKAIELFYANPSVQEAKALKQKNLNQWVSAGFYSASRLARGDRFTLPMDNLLVQAADNQLGLLLIEDRVTDQQYVSMQGNRSDLALFGAKKSSTKAAAWGVSDSSSKQIRRDKPLSEQDWSDLLSSPLGAAKKLINPSNSAEIKAKKVAHIRMTLPKALKCKEDTIDGQLGGTCILRDVQFSNEAGWLDEDKTFTVKSPVTAQKDVKFQVAGHWYKLGEKIALKELADSKSISIFYPLFSSLMVKETVDEIAARGFGDLIFESKARADDVFEVNDPRINYTGAKIKPLPAWDQEFGQSDSASCQQNQPAPSAALSKKPDRAENAAASDNTLPPQPAQWAGMICSKIAENMTDPAGPPVWGDGWFPPWAKPTASTRPQPNCIWPRYSPDFVLVSGGKDFKFVSSNGGCNYLYIKDADPNARYTMDISYSGYHRPHTLLQWTLCFLLFGCNHPWMGYEEYSCVVADPWYGNGVSAITGGTVTEGEVAKFYVSLDQYRPVGGEVLSLRVDAGSAKPPEDYLPQYAQVRLLPSQQIKIMNLSSEQSLVLLAGTQQVEVSIVTRLDGANEGSETFSLLAKTRYNWESGQMTILDNPQGPLFSVAYMGDSSAVEGSELVFNILFSAPAAKEGDKLKLQASYAFGEGNASKADFASTATLSFQGCTAQCDPVSVPFSGIQQVAVPEGATAATYRLAVLSDAVVEGDEVMSFQASARADASDKVIATGTITDNISSSDIEVKNVNDPIVKEGERAMFHINLTGAADRQKIHLESINQTTSDSDLGLSDVNIIFSPNGAPLYQHNLLINKDIPMPQGTTSVEVQIPALNDAIAEKDETFLLRTYILGGNVELEGKATILGSSDADLIVSDVSNFTEKEGATFPFEATFNKESQGENLLKVKIKPDTASTMDYAPEAIVSFKRCGVRCQVKIKADGSEQTVQVPEGEVAAVISVSTLQDEMSDDDEQFFVEVWLDGQLSAHKEGKGIIRDRQPPQYQRIEIISEMQNGKGRIGDSSDVALAYSIYVSEKQDTSPAARLLHRLQGASKVSVSVSGATAAGVCQFIVEGTGEAIGIPAYLSFPTQSGPQERQDHNCQGAEYSLAAGAWESVGSGGQLPEGLLVSKLPLTLGFVMNDPMSLHPIGDLSSGWVGEAKANGKITAKAVWNSK